MHKHTGEEARKVKATPTSSNGHVFACSRSRPALQLQLAPTEPQLTARLVLLMYRSPFKALAPSFERDPPLTEQGRWRELKGKAAGSQWSAEHHNLEYSSPGTPGNSVLGPSGEGSCPPSRCRSMVQQWTAASISDHASTSYERLLVKANLRLWELQIQTLLAHRQAPRSIFVLNSAGLEGTPTPHKATTPSYS